MRAACGRAPTAQSPQLPEGPALQQGRHGQLLCLPWARASLGSLRSQQSPGTQGTKYMPCCGQALPGKRSQKALGCPVLLEVRLGLGLPFARSVRGARYQPAQLNRSKTKEKAIWHSLSACPVSTCTYESCSSARCLCLPPRLVTLGFVTRAWRFRGCSACSVLATSTSWPSAGSARGAVTGKVSGILSCLASPSRSLWSNSCYFAFSTINSHTSTEMLKQDGETQNSALPALPAQPPLHPPLAKPK